MARIAKAKRCPFCASESNFVECMDFGQFAVICNDCGAQGPETDGDDCDPDGDNARGRRTATRAWNKRRRPQDKPAAMTDLSRRTFESSGRKRADANKKDLP